MRTIDVAGSHYEMGRQYGRLLERAGFSPPPVSQSKAAFVRASAPAVRAHAPELLEELRGIADAGGWDSMRLEAIPLALGWEAGCSVVATSGDNTADGAPLFGRNYDFVTSFADYAELYRTRPADGFASVGCSDHWTGRQDGINEAGLAIGHTFVPNRGPEPGVMFGLATRAVLDACERVSEAVAFLERIPHARNTNFVIADAAGAVVVVEASPEAVAVTTPQGGVGVATNHFVSASMAGYEPIDADRSNSERRYEHLTEWAAAATPADLGVDRLQRVLADPATGVCACASADADDPIETLWSWTATLDGPEASLARGRPDEHRYEPVEL